MPLLHLVVQWPCFLPSNKAWFPNWWLAAQWLLEWVVSQACLLHMLPWVVWWTLAVQMLRLPLLLFLIPKSSLYCLSWYQVPWRIQAHWTQISRHSWIRPPVSSMDRVLHHSKFHHCPCSSRVPSMSNLLVLPLLSLLVSSSNSKRERPLMSKAPPRTHILLSNCTLQWTKTTTTRYQQSETLVTYLGLLYKTHIISKSL